MLSRILLLVCALGAATAFAKPADLQGRENRLSFNYGLMIGYLANRKLPLDIHYERLAWDDWGLAAAGGFLAVKKYESDARYFAQIGLRRYFDEHSQGWSLGTLPYFVYTEDPAAAEYFIHLPVVGGYNWQWSRLFTVVEVGFGPGIRFITKGNGSEGSNPVWANLRLGWLF